jgi:CRP-like cAMP-binding protein
LQNMELQGASEESVLRLGLFLIYLDLIVLVVSFGTIYSLVQKLRRKVRNMDINGTFGKGEDNGADGAVTTPQTHVVPVGGGESSDQTDASAAGFTAFIHQEAITTLHEQEVDELHREHDFHEEALRRRQSKLQSNAKRKTEMRLVARTKVRKSKVLRQLPLFSGMSESDLEAVLDATKFERFSEGTVICSQGDLALKFYIVVNGTCRVSVTQPALPGSDSTTPLVLDVARLNTLQYFGEGCFEQVTKDQRRMATVTACTESGVQLLSLHRDDLGRLVEQEVIRCGVISELRQVGRERSRANARSLMEMVAGPGGDN